MLSEALDLAEFALEHHGKLRGLVEKLWKLLTKGHVRLVVFGSAGAGKSSLGKLLAGQSVDAAYRESTHTETYKLGSSTVCSILVPPGQSGLRASTWSDLARLVSSGKSTVVIHVACWGLTAIEPLKYDELPVFEDGMSPAEAMAAHAERQRQAELETLAEFARQLELAPGKLSMVSVVTKQDLWWGERAAVRQHYERGAYAEAIDALRNKIGAQNFSHKIWSAGLISKNLRDGAGTVLVPTAAGYDEPLRAGHAQRLIELIHAEAEHG